MQITGNGILFTNWSDEDFTWTFDKQPFTFPARSSAMISLGSKEHNIGVANLFAKHLTDREMNKQKIPTNHFTRPDFLSKCFQEMPVVVKEESRPFNNEMGVAPEVPAPKKMGRPKKSVEQFEPAK